MDNTAIERFYRLSESNQDDPEIQYQIALCYLNGEGVEQDGQMAQELLQQAANQGHAEAKSLLNSLTGYGRSSAVSLTKETLPDWCLKAEDGDADAQYQVACWFMNSNSPGSAEESDRYLNMAIEQGHGPACLLLAKRYLQQDRATDAIQLLLNARDCGLTEATALLGQCYAEGIGTPKDPAKAEEFLIEAAEYSGGEAKLKLAVRYATGNGVPLMPGKALNWVKRAQDNGIEDAMEQCERLRSEYWLKIKEQEEQARLEVEAEKRREEEKVRGAQEAKQKHQEEYERRLAEAKEQDKAEALRFTKILTCVILVVLIFVWIFLFLWPKMSNDASNTADETETVATANADETETEVTTIVDNHMEDEDNTAVTTAEEADPEVLGSIGSYVAMTDDQSRLLFIDNEESRGVPYGGIVYASDFREVDDDIQAWVRFAGNEGWVAFDQLSWLDEEDYSIVVGDVCYVHKRDSEGMNLREEASSESASIGTLYYGEEITIEAFDGDWGKINYHGTEGWVLMQRIAKYVPGITYMTVGTDIYYVELKESASTNADTVAKIPIGCSVEISGFQSGWAKVSYESESGYVQMYYLVPTD